MLELTLDMSISGGTPILPVADKFYICMYVRMYISLHSGYSSKMANKFALGLPYF